MHQCAFNACVCLQVLNPGGVQECCEMEPSGSETVFLRWIGAVSVHALALTPPHTAQ